MQTSTYKDAIQTTGVSVTVARDQMQLAALEEDWNDLARNALEPSPFYEPWMFFPWLETRPWGDAIRCVLVWVYRGSVRKLGAVFPLQPPALYKGLPITALQSFSDTALPPCPPLVRAGHARACYTALMDWFARDGEGAELLELSCLPCDGDLHSALASVLEGRDQVVLGSSRFTRALFDNSLTGTREKPLRDEVVTVLSRLEARLAERGAVRRRILEPQDDAQRWIDDFLQLHDAHSHAQRRFMARVMTQAHSRGRLLMAGVDLDGRPVSRCVGFASEDRALAFKTAFDESFAAYWPGVMAELDLVRQLSFLPNLRWMDFPSPSHDGLISAFCWQRTYQTLLISNRSWACGLPRAVLAPREKPAHQFKNTHR